MSRFLKVFLGVGALAVTLFVVFYLVGNSNGSEASADTYSPSDEIIYPYDISKNPYKLKGQSGILDTVHVPLLQKMGGQRVVVPYPGGSLRFEKMLDEHTATFEVLAGGEDGVESDGEIAVEVEDAQPPDSTRPWRIFVVGSRDAVNGLGATIPLTVIKFEGYTSFPAPHLTPPQESQQSEPIQDAKPDAGTDGDQSQMPAPIERTSPSSGQSDPPQSPQ